MQCVRSSAGVTAVTARRFRHGSFECFPKLDRAAGSALPQVRQRHKMSRSLPHFAIDKELLLPYISLWVKMRLQPRNANLLIGVFFPCWVPFFCSDPFIISAYRTHGIMHNFSAD